MKVLFVCTGNSCRSPMAEFYFRYLTEQQHCQEELRCASAGISAADGGFAADSASVIMGRYGIDMLFFRSQRLTKELIDAADLVVPMTRCHADILARDFPGAVEKIQLLAGDEDIPDPYGGSLSEYQRIFEIMKKHIDLLFKQLKAGKV